MATAWFLVHVTDGAFAVLDRSGSPRPAEQCRGLVTAAPAGAWITTGITSGEVRVAVQAHPHPPVDVDVSLWEDVAEVSVEAPDGQLRLQGPQPGTALPAAPVLSAQGRGIYRLRVHARGRGGIEDVMDAQDGTGRDEATGPGETYLLTAWPAPPKPPLVIRAGSGRLAVAPGAAPPQVADALPLTAERAALLAEIARGGPPQGVPEPQQHPAEADNGGPTALPALRAPADLTSLLIRTDYTDEAAWQEAGSAASAPVPAPGGPFAALFTVVEDPELAGASTATLSSWPRDPQIGHLFVADAVTMHDPQRTLLVLDLHTDPGQPVRSFRVVPALAWAVQNNLSQANMDFTEFENLARRSGGTLRSLVEG